MARRAVTAVFTNQNQAYDAASEIKKLEGEGVRISQAAVVTKDSKGNVRVPDTKGDEIPWGTLGGPIVGGLIGLIAGPAGAAIGAGTGLFAGWTGDMVRLGMDEDVVRSVAAEVNPGDTAIVAEIEEGSTEPVDRIVASHGGRIYRTDLWS
jgi:uncharacterized membrane protein